MKKKKIRKLIIIINTKSYKIKNKKILDIPYHKALPNL